MGIARKLALTEPLTDKEEKERIILKIYDQAISENTPETSVWNNLANYFIDSKKYYEKCLMAFQKFEECEKKSDPDSYSKVVHCLKAWQVHMLDLLGRRDEAIKRLSRGHENLRRQLGYGLLYEN